MTQTLTVRVGADGVLTLPLGTENANKDVRVTVTTVEPGSARPPMSQEEWLQFIKDTAGKWEGELQRPPQGEYEQRDPL